MVPHDIAKLLENNAIIFKRRQAAANAYMRWLLTMQSRQSRIRGSIGARRRPLQNKVLKLLDYNRPHAMAKGFRSLRLGNIKYSVVQNKNSPLEKFKQAVTIAA